MMQLKVPIRLAFIALLVTSLSGCLLTKLVTMPMRVVGSVLSVAGAVVSVVPVVGNSVDEALEAVDVGIDTSADAIDKLPL
jgi:cytochrome c biogenesis protein ResB